MRGPSFNVHSSSIASSFVLVLFFLSFSEMSLFPSIFVLIILPFSRCTRMKSTSYIFSPFVPDGVFSFFLPRDHGLDFCHQLI